MKQLACKMQYLLPMSRLGHLFILCLMVIHAAEGNAQHPHAESFGDNVALLLQGQIDTLSLEQLQTIPLVQFDNEGWDFFNQHEAKSAPDGLLQFSALTPLSPNDIVDVHDNHISVLLRERDGFKIYLASFTDQGTPIEAFLLHDHYGYLYEKSFRAYSFNQPIHHNTNEKGFEFYQLTYGYEPIPTLESPTQDPIYHQSFHRVGVNGLGRIELQLSESTGNQMFRREQVELVKNEVAFHEFSMFCVGEKGVPLSAIWDKNFITHGDMESHDSITVYLEFEAKWDNRFLFLQPAEGTTILNVSQRHENILSFPGDGSTCTLPDWRRYRSPWRDLHCEENFVQTTSLNREERTRFSDYNETDLIQAFERRCGAVPSAASQSLIMEPSPDHVQVVVDCIVLRVRFENTGGTHEKFVLLKPASGC